MPSCCLLGYLLLMWTCSPSFTWYLRSIDEWWRQEPDTVYLQEISRNNSSYQDMLPLRFHEDGAPTTKSETCNFWSWTTPLAGRGSEISRFCPWRINPEKRGTQLRTSSARVPIFNFSGLRLSDFQLFGFYCMLQPAEALLASPTAALQRKRDAASLTFLRGILKCWSAAFFQLPTRTRIPGPVAQREP